MATVVEPPPLPERTVRRLLAFSLVNGWSVAGVAALGAVATAWQADWRHAGWALLVVVPGVLELHGRRRLARRNARGLAAMVGAQFLLLGIIWLYAWLRWRHFEPAGFWHELPEFARRQIDAEMVAAGLVPELDRPLFLQVFNTVACLLLAVVTLVYQGAVAIYYATRSAAVRAWSGPPSAADRLPTDPSHRH